MRHPAGATLVLALLVLLACGRGERLPNVVLVSIDTLRADHLGVYGYDRPTSPNIDRLAGEAVLFERAYSQSPKTAPSHMTILTGLYPAAHGVRNWADDGNTMLSPAIPTLASILSDAGYKTLALTDFGHVHPKLGFDRGFDAFAHGGANHAFLLGLRFLREYREKQGERGPPFFLFLHTYAVHDPYTPPKPFQRLFTDPDYAGAIIAYHAELSASAGPGWQPQHDLFWSRVEDQSKADLRHLRDLYDAGIRFTDQRLGQFLGGLEEQGFLEETIVVVLSDHGEEFGEHGGFLHNSVYQEVLHVPLVIRLPGELGQTSRSARIPQVVGLVDVLPTLLDLIGIEAPGHVQGRSLRPLLDDVSNSWEPTILSDWPLAGVVSLRQGPLKFIQKAESRELYDLTSDPGEQHDLAGEGPEEVRTASAELERLLDESRSLHADFVPGVPVFLEDETRRHLEALGYLEGAN